MCEMLKKYNLYDILKTNLNIFIVTKNVEKKYGIEDRELKAKYGTEEYGKNMKEIIEEPYFLISIKNPNLEIM